MSDTQKKRSEHGRVISFLLPLLLAVVVFQVLQLKETLEVFLFLIGSIWWSLYYPRTTHGPLPKDQVDLWYYTLGAIGVLVFYINAEGERNRLRLTEESVQLMTRVDTLENKISYLKTRPFDFEQIKKRSQELAASVSQETVDSAYTDFEKRIPENQLQGPINRDDLQFDSPTGNLKDLDASGALIEFDLKWGNTLRALANSKSPATMRAQIKEDEAAELDKLFVLNFDGYTLREALGVLAAPGGIQGEITKLQADLSATIAQHSDIQKTYIRTIQEVSGQESIRISQLQLILWPYILLMAFGMKIAKVCHIKK